jgi:type II secretory pathway component GspD/PulD (secretin)
MATTKHRQRGLNAGSAIVAMSLLCFGHDLAAQQLITVTTPDGQSVQVSPEQAQAMKSGRPPGAQPAGPPGAQPGQPPTGGKPGEGDKKKEGEGGDKKDQSSTAVKRPDKPPRVPDPREFEVKLDANGRVPPFNFIGQPWPDVMQWLASISKCSLDWQELPSDFLNLTTQRSYTLDEVRDLINRHLNARGYTAIQAGDVLSVFKIDKLDPSLVRRVNEDQLYDLKPYDFVKVSFELPADMEVDKAKDDVKQILSPSAKVFPLVATKRLLVMDSVANLRTVSELLNQERMIEDGRIVPKEFVLKHARPQQVIETLYVVLGVDPKAKPAQTDPQAQQQQMQMMQQMQQQGRNMPKMMPKEEAPKVYLAFNRQRNSVLANAPPEQMKIIERTIAYLDVPFGGGDTLDANAGASSSNERSMKKYPLTTLDPEKFVTTLEEIGGLSPYAEFKVDSSSKTLFALATESDHKKINSLIDQFDGTGRTFEVIPLRRLPADSVAATVNNLMAGQTKQEDDNSRRRYWNPWDDYGRNQDKKNEPVKGFGVDADIEHNRLLLWANEAELKRVHDLLVKLGEIPGGQQDSRPIRLIAPADAKDTAALLEKLRAAWPASGTNKLIIQPPPEKKAPQPEQQEPAGKPNSEPAAASAADRATAAGPTNPAAQIAARYATLDTTVTSSASDEPTSGTTSSTSPPNSIPAAEPSAASPKPAEPTGQQAPPPITITITEDGRLLLSSPDTAALDRMEELIEELSPPERRFKVFPLKYIRASEMWYDLTDYFKDDMQDDSGGYTRDWYGFMVPKGNQQQSGTGLSKRGKLMITYDRPSNSILVSNASTSQLADVEQLIAEFDKPTRSDSVEIRQTAAIKIEYSRPSVIAAAVKEVYRDLLSSKDKEFDRGNKGQERTSTERMTVINYGGSTSDSNNDRQAPMKVGFDGALSLGADDVSGVLIVSAQKGIFDDIVRMVRELDEQASPKTTVQVHRVSGNVSAEAIQKAIDKAVGKAWLGNRPEQLPNQTGPEGNKKRGEKNGNRNPGNPPGENGNSGNNSE